VALSRQPVPKLERAIAFMSQLIAHRSPDGRGTWQTSDKTCGLAHRRLAIIDLSETGGQPMTAPNGRASPPVHQQQRGSRGTQQGRTLLAQDLGSDEP
jgi:asparagine synthetase B (glutamine-hydrolysing)